jgi:hypothetical protein
MALSAQFGNLPQMQYLERQSLLKREYSGCVLADLLSQSLSVYVELEKTHWHLRLNQTGHVGNFDSESPVEVAREVCTTSLRLIASISRLQRVLDPTFNTECAALLGTVQDKIAEICELANERQSELPEHIATLTSQGAHEGTLRDTMPRETRKTI